MAIWRSRSARNVASHVPEAKNSCAFAHRWGIVGFRQVSIYLWALATMADQLLYLTELLGLKVYDLKGRRIGVVKDAALVPLVDPVRIDRYLIGAGYSWLTVRFDQIR